MPRYIRDNSYNKHENGERRPSITDKWKGNAGERQKSRVGRDVNNGLYGDDRGKTQHH